MGCQFPHLFFSLFASFFQVTYSWFKNTIYKRMDLMGIYQASSSPLNTRFVHPMTYLYFHLEASVHLNMPNICLVWFPPLLEIYNSLSGPHFIKQHYHSVIQTMKGDILDFSLFLTSLIQTIRESWCVQSSVLSQSPNHSSPSPRKQPLAYEKATTPSCFCPCSLSA